MSSLIFNTMLLGSPRPPLPGMEVWWDATQTILGAVSSWVDFSGNGNTATENTNQPINTALSISAMNGLLYNGSSSKLNAGNGASINDIFATGGCFVGVFKITGPGGGGNGRIWDKTQNNALINTQSGNGILVFNQTFSVTSGQWKLTNADIPYNATAIIMVTYDSSSSSNAPTIYVNSTTAKAITTVTPPIGTASSDAASSLYLGNRAAGDRSMAGYEGGRLLYNFIPSASQRANLMNYYAAKYAVTLS